MDNTIEDDKHHRLKSWQHCYNFFQTEEAKDNIDLACLHLGMYLASWGMYRGSGFLIQRDYKVHQVTVREILHSNYDKLRAISFENYDSRNIELLFKLINKITGDSSCKGTYEDVGYYTKLNKHGETINSTPNVTDTLVTKILLGTLGCIPAYDRYFKIGVKSIKDGQIKRAYRLDKENFYHLIQFAKENIHEFRTQDLSEKYPDMKLLDMYFWNIGIKNPD